MARTIKPTKNKLTSSINKVTKQISKTEKSVGKVVKTGRRVTKKISKEKQKLEREKKRKERERLEKEKLSKMTPEQKRRYMLRKAIKRTNQRIASIEKSGLKASDAYHKITSAKYGRQDIITEKKSGVRTPTAPEGTSGGGLKIRTDVDKMTKKELDAVENLIAEFESVPSTITEIKRDTGEKLKYFHEHTQEFESIYEGVDLPDDYEGEEFDVNEFDLDDMQQYLIDREQISSEAIAKAFYLPDEGFSDLYYAVESGVLSYRDAKEYAINALIWILRTEGFDASGEPFDEDIIREFYTGKEY